MYSLSYDDTRRRARGVATSLLIGFGLLLLALAADSMVTSLATAASTEKATLAGSDVAIFNLAGRARLDPGSGGSVQVTATLAGRDADQLELETADIRGRRTLVIHYPSSRIIYPEMGLGSSSMTRIRDDGTFDDIKGRHGIGGGSTVRVSGSGSGLEAHADLAISVPRGQKLSLYLVTGPITVTNVDGDLRLDTGSGAVNTTATRGDLVIDTGSGSINVGGATGHVDLDTGSGEVNVAAVTGDELNVDTGSGSIRGRDISVATLACDTGSGDVEVVGIRARRLSIDTGSGEVELTLASPCEELVVDTGSGDVAVNVPQGFGADISFESGSGDFACNLPVTVHEREHGSFRGRLGDGAARITVETGSGDMRLAANSRR
jgi:hypothetical protein